MNLRSVTYLLALALLSACSPKEEAPVLQEHSRVEMALTEPQTKAHFEDVNGTASFVWDVGSSMIAVVGHGSAPVMWNGGEYYSPMHISLIDPAKPNKVLRACSELSLESSAAQVRDTLFFLSPVSGSALCSTAASADSVTVEFLMPSLFEQSRGGALEEFEPYCYIRGESSVKSVPSALDKNFVANSTTFKAIPAIFRFNVSNNTNTDMVLESVKITCDKLFPDKLRWTTNGASMSVGETADKSGYFNTIKTSINWGRGETIPAKAGETVHKGTYYALCLPFDSDTSMQDATLAFILETSKKTYTFNIPAAKFFSSSDVKRFASNKIYNFNFSLGESSVELEGVSIADWLKDSFYLPIVDITADVKANISYWVQDRHNLYTYGFMKMFQDGAAYTMWAECNLKEYLYSSTEFPLNWYEVTPSDESPVYYLAPYYDYIKDFKWQTPSKADYEQLFKLPAANIEMCKDEESGVFGLKFKSVDNPGAYIFLPCSGHREEDTEYPADGSTVIHRTFHSYYWTRDAASDTDGWALHFAFSQVETVENKVSSFSEFTPVKFEGTALYEFVKMPKSNPYTVRAILKND